MRSIRLSLIVYFLLLLIAAESVAFWLVYRSAQDALSEKQEVNRQLLNEQFNRMQRDEEEKFKAELLEAAKGVELLALRPSQRERLDTVSLLPLGQFFPQSHVSLGTLLLFTTPSSGPGVNRFRDMAVSRVFNTTPVLSVPQERLPQGQPGEVEYFQVNCDWVEQPWLSRSLQGEPMHFDKNELNPFVPRYDTYTFSDGRVVWRVIAKVTPRRGVFFRPGRGGGGRGQPQGQAKGAGLRDGGRDANGRPGQPRPGMERGPGRGMEFSGPWAVVQAARDHAILEKKLAELRENEIEAVQAHDEAARDSLAALRNRLLAIGGGTIVAMLLGGLLLVGYGLAPLQKLSDAVSRVSPSDFRLPLDSQDKLPSELVPIRERLGQTLVELRKAFEREKQASADISHELRTPVASLLTTVEVALKKTRTADEYRRTLEECRAMGRQMRQLVERIMAIARLDAGSDRIKPRAVDVSEVVAESAALVRPLAAERGLELRVHCSKPVTVTTDPDKLREVLVNLLHNAVQYNRPQGAVDVAADRNNGWVDLTVQDTGIGIQPEAREHIFERFYRVDASRHADDLHAGLGLSIVKGYVGLLGGTISVESEPGQGSTFRVRLPAA
jgi:signal transduction histidine kinase